MASRRNRFRTKYCRNFALGYCPQGSQCKYIHALNPPSISPVAPISQPFHPFARQPELNTNFSFPTAAPPSAMPWQISPPIHTPEMGHYNWVYQPAQFGGTNTAAPVPTTQYKPLSWRTTLCRHFAKNRGWCPLSEECNYIHDLQLADAALEDVRFPNNHVTAGSLASSTARVNDGHGQAATKHSHCWAYVQGLCNVNDCPYLHPAAVYLFVPHTPCLAWPNCHKGALCPYKHPEPNIPRYPAMQMPIESPPRMQPPSPLDHTLSGAYQYSGTTYFQGPLSPVRVDPPRVTWAHPYQTWRPMYHPSVMRSGYPLPSSSEAPQWAIRHPWDSHSVMDDRPQWHEGPMQTEHPIYEVGPSPLSSRTPRQDLHAAPQTPQHLYAAPPVVHIAPNTPSPNYTYQPMRASFSHFPTTAEDEFPYVPQKNQRVGHARRVSVTLKSKEDSDALGLTGTGRQRESWQTHGDRFVNRSWAPSTSSANMPGTTPAPPLIF